jgi:hypothetical protein
MTVRPPCNFSTETMGADQNKASCGSYDSGQEDSTWCDPEDDPGDTMNFLKQNSILWPSDLNVVDDFRRTTVHTIIGLADDTQGPVGGLSFYENVDSRKRLWYIAASHDWIDGASAGRRALKFALEFFTRPWAGDVDYDGDVDLTDYRETCKRVVGCCTTSPGPVQCVTPPSGCPSTPDPDDTVTAPNYDVDNDGDVDSGDVAIIALVGGCSSSSCSSPVTFKECEEPQSSFLTKELYPDPSGVDCIAGSVHQCGGVQCACTPP